MFFQKWSTGSLIVKRICLWDIDSVYSDSVLKDHDSRHLQAVISEDSSLQFMLLVWESCSHVQKINTIDSADNRRRKSLWQMHFFISRLILLVHAHECNRPLLNSYTVMTVALKPSSKSYLFHHTRKNSGEIKIVVQYLTSRKFSLIKTKFSHFQVFSFSPDHHCPIQIMWAMYIIVNFLVKLLMRYLHFHINFTNSLGVFYIHSTSQFAH